LSGGGFQPLSPFPSPNSYSGLLRWSAPDKVNEQLPVKEGFCPLFWGPDAHWKLRHEYRRL
jgi:hypothetical protein